MGNVSYLLLHRFPDGQKGKVMKRFNLQVIKVENGGEEEIKPWVIETQVLSEIRSMKEGDELVIQRAEDSHGI
jgi:hypothetical protein